MRMVNKVATRLLCCLSVNLRCRSSIGHTVDVLIVSEFASRNSEASARSRLWPKSVNALEISARVQFSVR